jgi:CDP-diglyceride synthetase
MDKKVRTKRSAAGSPDLSKAWTDDKLVADVTRVACDAYGNIKDRDVKTGRTNQMSDVWVRFVSALIATLLSICCFYQAGVWLFVWWFFVHTTIIIELDSMLQENKVVLVVNFIVSEFFFIWLCWGYVTEYASEGINRHVLEHTSESITTHSIMIEVMLAILFIPFLVALVTHQNFWKSSSHAISYLWITVPCYYGWELSTRSVGFIVGFLNIVWFMDAGAYFSGKLFGRTPLLQAISPRKTVEGTLGGAVITQVVTFIVSYFVPIVPYRHWIVIGLISSTVGQCGDLFESMYKRSLNRKDSGGIMPGHGGFLDRFDAVVFSLIFTHAYLKLVHVF